MMSPCKVRAPSAAYRLAIIGCFANPGSMVSIARSAWPLLYKSTARPALTPKPASGPSIPTSTASTILSVSWLLRPSLNHIPSSLRRLCRSTPAALPMPRDTIVPMFSPNVLTAQSANSSSKSNGGSSSSSKAAQASTIKATVEKPQRPVTPEKIAAMPIVPTKRARASRFSASGKLPNVFQALRVKNQVICCGNCLN